MMCIMGQYISWAQYLAKHFQCLVSVVTLCICVLIYDTITPKDFLGGICLFDFEFSFIFTKSACSICDLWVNFTAFCLLSLNKIMQNSLLKIQVCTKSISVTMENNKSHKSGANSTLYNVSMKGLPLSSRIFIWLILFVLLWQNSHLQLWYIYLFPPTNPI